MSTATEEELRAAGFVPVEDQPQYTEQDLRSAGFVPEGEKPPQQPGFFDRAREAIKGRGDVLSTMQRIAQGSEENPYIPPAQNFDPKLLVKAGEIWDNYADPGKVLKIVQSVPLEQRTPFLQAAEAQAQTYAKDRDSGWRRVVAAMNRGTAGPGQSMAEFVGLGGSPEDIKFMDELRSIADRTVNPAQATDPFYARLPLQALELAPKLAMAGRGGVPGTTAAFGLPRGQSIYRQKIAEGASESEALTAATVGAGTETAVFTLNPYKFVKALPPGTVKLMGGEKAIVNRIIESGVNFGLSVGKGSALIGTADGLAALNQELTKAAWGRGDANLAEPVNAAFQGAVHAAPLVAFIHGAQMPLERLQSIAAKAEAGTPPSRTDAQALGIPAERASRAADRLAWFKENREALLKSATPEPPPPDVRPQIAEMGSAAELAKRFTARGAENEPWYDFVKQERGNGLSFDQIYRYAERRQAEAGQTGAPEDNARWADVEAERAQQESAMRAEQDRVQAVYKGVGPKPEDWHPIPDGVEPPSHPNVEVTETPRGRFYRFNVPEQPAPAPAPEPIPFPTKRSYKKAPKNAQRVEETGQPDAGRGPQPGVRPEGRDTAVGREGVLPSRPSEEVPQGPRVEEAVAPVEPAPRPAYETESRMQPFLAMEDDALRDLLPNLGIKKGVKKATREELLSSIHDALFKPTKKISYRKEAEQPVQPEEPPAAEAEPTAPTPPQGPDPAVVDQIARRSISEKANIHNLIKEATGLKIGSKQYKEFADAVIAAKDAMDPNKLARRAAAGEEVEPPAGVSPERWQAMVKRAKSEAVEDANRPVQQPQGDEVPEYPPGFDKKSWLKGKREKKAEGETSRSPESPTTVVAGIQTVEVPLAELTLSEDVPNFKEGASAKTGVVEPLSGKYERLGTAPIIVWERTDGRKEVVTGRHRLDLARRSGEETIPSQVVREADGWTAEKVSILDAESNIRDNQGTVRDYVNYFKNATAISEEEASRRGLLSRDKGRQGFFIGRHASPDVLAGFLGGKLSGEKAATIADVGRGDEGLQGAGLEFAASGMSAEAIRHSLSNLKRFGKAPQERQGDLFGFDRSWIEESKAIGQAAADIIGELRSSFAKANPAARKKLGGDWEAVKAENKRLEEELLRWQKWETDPELMRQVRERAGLPTTPARGEEPMPDPPREKPAPGQKGMFDDIQEKADKGPTETDETRGFLGGGKRQVKKRQGAIPDAIKADDPEMERRLEQAHGLKRPSLVERVKDFATTAWHAITRPRLHISARKMPVVDEHFRLFQEIGNSSQDEVIRTVAGMVDTLKDDAYLLYERYTAIRNLNAAIEAGQPVRFTDDGSKVTAYLKKLEGLVDRSPEVQAVLKARAEFMDKFVRELVQYKQLPANVLENVEDYFHQQVAMKMEADRRAGTASPKVIKRSYQKKRVTGPDVLGEEYDWNTNYVESEVSWMTDAMIGLKTEKWIRKLEEITGNQLPRLKRSAKARNFETLVGGPENVARINELRGLLRESWESEDRNESYARQQRKAWIEEMEDLDPTYPYRKKIAWATETVRAAVKSGEVDVGKFAKEKLPALDPDAIDADNMTDSQWFGVMNWVAEKQQGTELGTAAGAFFKAIADRESLIRDKLGNKYQTWESLLPEGMEAWHPEPGNRLYVAHTIPEKFAERLMENIGSAMQIKAEDLRAVLAMGGPKRTMVVPAEVARQLGSMAKPAADGWLKAIDDLSRHITGLGKTWFLNAPHRIAGYSARNALGDHEPVVASMPSVVAYEKRAAQEAWDYFRGKKLAMSPELRAARDLGVLSSSMTAQEIPDLKDVPVLNRLFDQKASPANIPKWYFEEAKRFGNWRESVARYAVFLKVLDEMKAGRALNYGASNKRVVDAIRRGLGDEAAAAHISRNLVGDYGNVTVMGDWLRNHFAWFWSFQEINLKRWPMLAFNSVKEGREAMARLGKAGVSVGTVYGAALAMRYGWMMAAYWAWNNLLRPDEEKDQPKYVQQNAHINLGRNADGTVRSFNQASALAEFAEWFGLNTLGSLYPKYQAGQLTATDLVKEMVKDPFNKAITSIRPDVKVPFEVATGKSLFPDPTNPQTKPRDELAMAPLGVPDLYKTAKGMLLGTGDRGRPNMAQRFMGLTVSDPRQNALSEIHDLRGRFLASKGKDVPQDFGTSKSKPMREAAATNDRDAFAQAKRYYIEHGGTFKSFVASLDRIDPVENRLPNREEVEFEQKFLTAVQREKLGVARRYAQDLKVTMWKWWHETASPEEKAVLIKENKKSLSTMRTPVRGADESKEEFQKRLDSAKQRRSLLKQGVDLTQTAKTSH